MSAYTQWHVHATVKVPELRTILAEDKDQARAIVMEDPRVLAVNDVMFCASDACLICRKLAQGVEI